MGASASRVTFLADVHGDWDYFVKYVTMSAALDVRRHASDTCALVEVIDEIDLILREDYQLVIGGNMMGGKGTIRIMKSLVGLKKKYPERVHFLLGSQDVSMMRITSELGDTEISRLKTVGYPAWFNDGEVQSPLQYITAIAMKHEGLSEAEALETGAIAKHNTKSNRLRWILEVSIRDPCARGFAHVLLSALHGCRRSLLASRHS